MSKLSALLKRFQRDERGAFLAIFGLIAVVLIATSGSVVDFVSVDQARTRAQLALDATALALQRDITTLSKSQIQSRAQAFLIERLGDKNLVAAIAADDVKVDLTEGSLYLRATVKVPLNFVSLIGVDTINVSLASQATRKNLFVEVAFVLDNSGSMDDYSRMTNLKKATRSATNILFYGDDFGGSTAPGSAVKNDKTKVGIVPFAYFVNVGSNNSSASWMDQLGASSISNDNFDNDDDDSTPFTGKVNRLALYANLKKTSWKGCVEARPGAYATNDAVPTTSTPDTLFVPSFEPDNRDKYSDESSSSYKYWNNYLVDDGGSCPQNPNVSSLSETERQERLCKYTNATVSGGDPNGPCINTPILPLTDNVSDIRSTISAMESLGGTNIHQGAIWGFHILSPTQPFAEAKPYEEATAKVMIIMTDGENTFYANKSNINRTDYYSPYSFLKNGRIATPTSSQSQVQVEVDKLTLATCANAKAAGIKVYTVGLESSNDVKKMLTDCASDISKAYFPSKPEDLNTVFKSIAAQLAELRIEF